MGRNHALTRQQRITPTSKRPAPCGFFYGHSPKAPAPLNKKSAALVDTQTSAADNKSQQPSHRPSRSSREVGHHGIDRASPGLSQVARRCCLPHPRGIRPAQWRSWAWARSACRVSARLPVRQSTVHGMGKELRAGCPVESRREAMRGARQRIWSRRWNTALAFR